MQDLYSAGIAETKAAGGAVSTLAAKFEAMVLRKTDGIAVVHERFGSNVANKMGISEDKIRINSKLDASSQNGPARSEIVPL